MDEADDLSALNSWLESETWPLSRRVFNKLWRNNKERIELSVEQLKFNDEMQQDEVLALQAIYGDDVRVMDNDGNLRCFQILVHCVTSDDVEVSVKINSSNSETEVEIRSLNEKIDDSDENLYTFIARYFPPLVLTCLLPRSYPCHHPPYFTISANWLDAKKISDLCHNLDSIWMQESGQEITYKWVEWLHNYSLSHLGFHDRVPLDEPTVLSSQDIRAISASSTPELTILLMIDYDQHKRHKAFCSNIHQCAICFNDYAGTDFLQLPCKHFFCRNCMDTFCNMHVKEGSVTMLLCPDVKCKGLVPPDLLKQLLSSQTYEKWESLVLGRALDSMSDIVYCPRCFTACLEEEDHHAQCLKCLFNFCSQCGDPRHVGSKCRTYEEALYNMEMVLPSKMMISSAETHSMAKGRKEDNLMKQTATETSRRNRPEVTEGTKQSWRSLARIYRKGGKRLVDKDRKLGQQKSGNEVYDKALTEYNKLMHRRNEILSFEEARRSSKQCPTCKMGITKIGGCCRMQCTNCGTFFCYVCCKPDGFNHFVDGRCRLYII